MPSLPRPLYGRTESLPNRALTRRHSHPWVQLSYAIQGVLEVQTSAGRFVAPPERAVWIPAGVPHRVFSSPHTEMRSLYIDCSVAGWALERCHVLGVSDLLRELIRAFSLVPVEYDEGGAHGRLAQVILDQLAEAPQIDLMLPLPRTAACDRSIKAWSNIRNSRPHCSTGAKNSASPKKPSAACFYATPA